MDVFFFGTLRHPPLLEAVIGRPAAGRPAALPHHAVRWVDGESWPMLLPARGESAPGILVTVDGTEAARLHLYEAPFGYRPHPYTVETADGPRDAQVYRPDEMPTPGAPFDLDRWVRDWGDISVTAAPEILRVAQAEGPEAVRHRFPIIRARAHARLRGAARRRPRTVGQDLGRDAVEPVEVRRPYEAFFAVEEHVIRHRLFDGSLSPVLNRGVFLSASAVTVLPYDPVRDRVLMVEQIRIGAYAIGDPHPWLLEPVAGLIDAGETPEVTARRETREEAHVDLGALHHVSGYYPSPGALAQFLVTYVGIADLPERPTATGGLDHENEDLRVHIVPLDTLLDMVASGEAANAPLVISALWLGLNRDRLRAA